MTCKTEANGIVGRVSCHPKGSVFGELGVKQKKSKFLTNSLLRIQIKYTKSQYYSLR